MAYLFARRAAFLKDQGMGTTKGADKRALERPQHWLASAFALHLVHLVERWHVSSAQLLEGLGISESELAEPGAMLPLDTVIALWDRARALTGEPGLGFHLGLSERAIGWGYPGFAAMSAETYGQALEGIRYTPVVSTMFSLRLEVNGGTASLIAEEHSDPKSVRDMLLGGLLLGLRHVGEDITGGRLEASIDFSIPEPDYYKRFAALVPRVRFAQSVSRLFFPDSSLALPLVMADPIAKRLARDQCEQALQDIGADEVFVAIIRRSLFGSDGFRSQHQVALKLGVTPRNLMRMLAQRGTSFAGLVDDEREKRARRMLFIPGVTIEEVAAQLGYSTASNFVRAFHRWTGQTPAAYRRSMQTVRAK
jgi:AraC-like DNA-binding protein